MDRSSEDSLSRLPIRIPKSPRIAPSHAPLILTRMDADLEAALNLVATPGRLSKRLQRIEDRAVKDGYFDIIKPRLLAELRRRAAGGKAYISTVESDVRRAVGLPDLAAPWRPSRHLTLCPSCRLPGERALCIGYCDRCGSWCDSKLQRA